MVCKIEITTETEIAFPARRSCVPELHILFSDGDTCWQMQTPVATSGKGSVAKLIWISEYRSGFLLNDTQESGKNWSYSAKVRKDRRNTHQVFKYMKCYYERK